MESEQLGCINSLFQKIDMIYQKTDNNIDSHSRFFPNCIRLFRIFLLLLWNIKQKQFDLCKAQCFAEGSPNLIRSKLINNVIKQNI